jgi:hypothetical protein
MGNLFGIVELEHMQTWDGQFVICMSNILIGELDTDVV